MREAGGVEGDVNAEAGVSQAENWEVRAPKGWPWSRGVMGGLRVDDMPYV